MSGQEAIETESEGDADEPESDNRPEIEDEDRAELDLDGLAEDIENETAPGDTDDTDTQPEEDGGESGEETDASGENGLNVPQGPEHSVGDQYVAVLALLSATLVEEFGDEGSEDPDVVREKVEGIATQEPFDLAGSVDALLAQSGVGADLPPGKALVLGTVIVMALVVLPETNLVSVAMERLQAQGVEL